MPRQSNGNGPVRRASAARTARKRGAGVDSMFHVFADHTRVRILRLLQDGPLRVGDLVDILRAPQPTVSYGSPVTEILKKATDGGVTLIVMGRPGKGIYQRAVLGQRQSQRRSARGSKRTSGSLPR